MLQIELTIYNGLIDYLKDKEPKVEVTQRYVDKASTLPHVHFSEINNIPRARFNTKDGSKPNDYWISYQVEVYTNINDNGIQNNHNIRYNIISYFESIGFNCTYNAKIPNLLDNTVCRGMLRFTAIVDNNLVTYKR